MFALVLLLFACSRDEEGMKRMAVRKATISLLVSVNGMGDNGYNDAAAEGVFAFANADGARVRLLVPNDGAEAEGMYHMWLAEYAMQDSSVLIIASSAYEDMARRVSASEQDRLLMLKEHGGRVLLFESGAEINGISTVKINRYGVSFLAGAMSHGFDALILAATKDDPLLEESIAGFMDGHGRYADMQDGKVRDTELYYLAEDEGGFAMPDSAYRFVAERNNYSVSFNKVIFPLLGGSVAGVVRMLNDDVFTQAMMIGMDVDMSRQCMHVPFSVSIRIGDVLRGCLSEWRAGRVWPRHRCVGMKDGGADIVISKGEWDSYAIIKEFLMDSDGLRVLRERYMGEALVEEERYYE